LVCRAAVRDWAHLLSRSGDDEIMFGGAMAQFGLCCFVRGCTLRLRPLSDHEVIFRGSVAQIVYNWDDR
jgi:hypothetical protein